MDERPRISEAEWAVMEVVWEQEPVAAQDVAARLGPGRDWSPRTVKTLLARLVKKGVLGFEEEGRRYRYHALLSRAACVREEGRSFARRVFGGRTSPLLAHFVREGELSAEEIAELRRLLDEQEGEQ